MWTEPRGRYATSWGPCVGGGLAAERAGTGPRDRRGRAPALHEAGAAASGEPFEELAAILEAVPEPHPARLGVCVDSCHAHLGCYDLVDDFDGVFLDDAGASVNADLGEFELRLTPANASLLTFSRTGWFTATLTGVAAGSTSLDFVLWHRVEQHEDLGPWPVFVTVQ